MDDLLELVLEIVLEGATSVVEHHKKHGKIMKFFCILLLSLYALMILAVSIMLSMMVIVMWKEKNVGTAIFMLVITIAAWIYWIRFMKRLVTNIKTIKQKHRKEEL